MKQGRENPCFLNSGVWRVSTSGGAPTVIDSNASGGRLSPDGKRVLMIRAGRPSALLLTAIDGSGTKQLPSLAHTQRGTTSRYKWSPDGQSIDYLGDDGQLWRQPLTGVPESMLISVTDGIYDI